MTSNGAPEMLTCEPTVTPSSCAVVCPSTTTCACWLTCCCVKKTPSDKRSRVGHQPAGTAALHGGRPVGARADEGGSASNDRRHRRNVGRVRLVLEPRNVLHGQRVRGAGAAAHAEARCAAGGNREQVGAERGDARVHRICRCGADADGADDCGDTEENAEGGQDRAQPVTEQASESGVEGAEQTHAATRSLSWPSAISTTRSATLATLGSWVIRTMVWPDLLQPRQDVEYLAARLASRGCRWARRPGSWSDR